MEKFAVQQRKLAEKLITSRYQTQTRYPFNQVKIVLAISFIQATCTCNATSILSQLGVGLPYSPALPKEGIPGTPGRPGEKGMMGPRGEKGERG